MSDIETWSINTVLYKENFRGKNIRKMCTKNWFQATI